MKIIPGNRAAFADLAKGLPWPARILIARLRPWGAASVIKLSVIAALFGLFLWGDYALFRRLFSAIAEIEALTPFFALGLLENLLGMVFMIAFTVLFFSSLTASIGSFFSDLDLELYHAAPVSRVRIVIGRWGKSFVQSSYLVISFLIPLFVALAAEYGQGFGFVLFATVQLIILLAAAVSLAAALIILLVRFFPVRRVHQIALTLAIISVTVVVVGFRMIRPERLFAEIDTDDLARVLQTIELPASEYFPSTWFAALLVDAVDGKLDQIGPAIGLMAFSVVLFGLFLFVSRSYFTAFVRAKESLAPTAFGSGPMMKIIDRAIQRLDPPVRALLGKEIRVLTRDVAQWSQLFMMIALLFIYLYNVRILPLQGDFRAILVSYANLGMSGFVIAAICLRFAYPSVSAEGKAFWIIQSAPIAPRRLLLVKTIVFGAPLVVLAVVLTALADWLIGAPGFVWLWTISSSIVMAVTLVALGVGLGGLSPNFSSENPLEVGLSLGGFAYMALSMLYVGAMMLLTARPMHRFFLKIIFGVEMDAGLMLRVGPPILMVVMSIVLTVLPLELARVRLDRLRS